ncbi:BGTF surface domain-containing protein [Haloferax volcanii]|uniref:BGTF surface domain-containing protein n=1 Tax=Haloferax volcanii TaxID=2246 RepID=UPI003D303A13
MRPPYLIVTLAVVVALSLSGVVAADSGTAIDHAGDELTLDAVDGEHVHGTTPFAPGTLIGVRVKSVGDTHPFLVSKAVRVGENGSFDVTFDLSEMAQLRGGPVQVSVRRDQQPIYEENATLVTYDMPENSTLTPDIRDAATAETTSASTATTADSSSGIDVPGFGAGVGVAALLVASFVAARGL